MFHQPVDSEKMLVINTGGTMDSAYADPDHPPPSAIPLSDGNSMLPKALASLGLAEQCDLHHWHKGDSSRFANAKEMLRDLAAAIKQAPYQKIIVTHGTDFMAPNAAETLQSLQTMFPDGFGKTVVFTGALTPLANDPHLYVPDTITLSDGSSVTMQRKASDGLENLRDAVKTAQRMAEVRPEGGVYIAFHNEIFAHPSHTVKSNGRFTSTMPTLPIWP